jgi:transcriptional regulator with XRE-family HTH domain
MKVEQESKFNPKRLREARLIRGLSLSERAGKLKISKQAISQFELGDLGNGDTRITNIVHLLERNGLILELLRNFQFLQLSLIYCSFFCINFLRYHSLLLLLLFSSHHNRSVTRNNNGTPNLFCFYALCYLLSFTTASMSNKLINYMEVILIRYGESMYEA